MEVKRTTRRSRKLLTTSSTQETLPAKQRITSMSDTRVAVQLTKKGRDSLSVANTYDGIYVGSLFVLMNSILLFRRAESIAHAYSVHKYMLDEYIHIQNQSLENTEQAIHQLRVRNLTSTEELPLDPDTDSLCDTPAGSVQEVVLDGEHPPLESEDGPGHARLSVVGPFPPHALTIRVHLHNPTLIEAEDGTQPSFACQATLRTLEGDQLDSLPLHLVSFNPRKGGWEAEIELMHPLVHTSESLEVLCFFRDNTTKRQTSWVPVRGAVVLCPSWAVYKRYVEFGKYTTDGFGVALIPESPNRLTTCYFRPNLPVDGMQEDLRVSVGGFEVNVRFRDENTDVGRGFYMFKTPSGNTKAYREVYVSYRGEPVEGTVECYCTTREP